MALINFGMLDTSIPEKLGSMPGNVFAQMRQQKMQDEDRAFQREGQQMQNALARMQMTKAQSEMDEDAAFKNALRGSGGNYEQAMPDLMQASPSRAMAFQKTLAEQKKAGMDAEKGQFELVKQRFDVMDRAAGRFAANPTRQTAVSVISELSSIGVPPDVIKQMSDRLNSVPDEQLPEMAQQFLRATQEGIQAQTASLFPKPTAPTELSQLMAERDRLPPGDPRRAVYDRALAKQTTHAPAASINNFGQPVSAVDPQTGQPVLVQFSKDGTPKVAPFAPYNANSAEAARKKEVGARTAIDLLDEAEQWVGKATGSQLGALRDNAGRVVGASTEASEAAARLSALQGALMMAQPRMEGPQSNLDVKLYEAMAGKIGDPTVPAGEKRAAMGTIRNLHQKYTNGGQQSALQPAPAAAPPAPAGLPSGWSVRTR